MSVPDKATYLFIMSVPDKVTYLFILSVLDKGYLSFDFERT
jgi:hypothetical protein